MPYAKICTDIRHFAGVIHNFQPIVFQKRTAVLQFRILIQHHVPGRKQSSCIAVWILDVLLCPERILCARKTAQLIDRRLQNMAVLICRRGCAGCFLTGFLNDQLAKQRFIKDADNLQLFFIQHSEGDGVCHFRFSRCVRLCIRLFQLDAVLRCLVVLPDVQMIVISLPAHQFL